jgi:hypothetical protein
LQERPHIPFIPDPCFQILRNRTEEEKHLKNLFFIYGTTFQKNRIWTEYLASPDLEQSLTEIKKELLQAPIAHFISHVIFTLLGEFSMGYYYILLISNVGCVDVLIPVPT